jgi:hypothetical protein
MSIVTLLKNWFKKDLDIYVLNTDDTIGNAVFLINCRILNKRYRYEYCYALKNNVRYSIVFKWNPFNKYTNKPFLKIEKRT